MLKKRVFLIFSSSLLFISQMTLASDFQSPRSSGLGGAGHASPMGTDAIFLNPSFMSFIPVLTGSFSYLVYPTNPSSSVVSSYSHDLNIAVQHGGRELPLQLGFGYTHRSSYSKLHFAISKAISEDVAVGVGTKLVLKTDSSTANTLDGTFSLSWLASSFYRMSFIVDNMFNSDIGNSFSREFILGNKINILSLFQVYFDPHWTSDSNLNSYRFGYESGLELPLFDFINLRTGIYQNSTLPFVGQRFDGFGLGAGLLLPRVSLDYSYSKAFQVENVFNHNFGISVYF